MTKTKLQFCLESNYAVIFQLNSFPGKIFLASDWEFFFLEIGEKRRIFWIGNGALIFGPW